MWYYNEKEFTSEMIEDYIGFVYLITDLSNNKKYIGKKTLQSKRKLPPLKGKTRRRTKIVESNWQDYFGSSEEVKLSKGLNIMTRFGGCPMAISGRLLSSFLIAGVVDNEIMT